MPKIISIVTPSYNQGEFLEQTIQSILSQEGDFFIDYLIMDGGSTDHSVEIIKKYQKQLDEHCDTLEINSTPFYIKTNDQDNVDWHRCQGIAYRWCSEPDGGQTAAINKGFRLAQGQVVAWLNSDDTYFPQAFQKVLDVFQDNPMADFVYGDGDVIDENNQLQWEWLSRPYHFSILKTYHYLWNNFTNYIMQQATFWRRSVLDKIGYLDESFSYAMDVEYWVRAGAKGSKLLHIPVKPGKFRMISGTKSLSSPTVFWPDMLEIYRRYNGAHKMAPYFTYYFYNIAIHNQYDLAKVLREKTALFDTGRWRELPEKEKNILEQQGNKGYYKSCLLSSHHAFYTGDVQVSQQLFRDSLKQKKSLIFHPLTSTYLIKSLLGRKISRVLQQFKKKLVSFYRQQCYDYRYTRKKRTVKNSN